MSVRVPDEADYFNLPILPAARTMALGSMVNSASNENEYQKSSWGVKKKAAGA
jgi:hypothetical protein